MASEISMILASSRDEGKIWTILGASTADESDVHLHCNFPSRIECSGFFAHIEKICENGEKMWK